MLNVDPITGTLLRQVIIPGAKQVTSVAFGGAELDELYVTSASCGISTASRASPEHARAGQLFVVKGLGVKGTPSQAFVCDEGELARLQSTSATVSSTPVSTQIFALKLITDGAAAAVSE